LVVLAQAQVAHTKLGAVGYRVVGSGPPLVLIMGYSGTMEDWDPRFVDALARHYRVVIFDNAGVGADQSMAYEALAAGISSYPAAPPGRGRPDSGPGQRVRTMVRRHRPGRPPDRPADWRMPEHPAEPPARHPYLIMNPKSGGGKVERFDLRRRAEDLGAEVFLIGGPGPADVAQIAREAVAQGADLLASPEAMARRPWWQASPPSMACRSW
jgi:hypothetical protein